MIKKTPQKILWDTLYESINGMSLQEMDTFLDPVCTLCRDHQRSGFVEGIRIGVRLREELAEEKRTEPPWE